METLPQHQAHPSIAFNDSTLNFNSMSTANADQDRNAGIRAVHLKKKTYSYETYFYLGSISNKYRPPNYASPVQGNRA